MSWPARKVYWVGLAQQSQGIDSLYVAGDWVGDEDQQAGAAFASATRAAHLISETVVA